MVKTSSKSNLRTVAVIPAAGSGIRMENERPKQFLDVDGRPLLAVTLEKFQVCPLIHTVILLVPEKDLAHCQREIVERHRLTKVEKVLVGGERRQDSVRLGIEASGGDYELVMIHDGVRPLVTVDLIARVVAAAQEHRAVITGLPAKETVKEIDQDALVVRTYDRQKVWLVQTPQVFRYEDILMAHSRALERGWEEVTDDALLVERVGIPVKVVEGSEDNIKVTTPQDLELVKFLLGREDRK
ncbi:MAG: 2-C-methyl-D-erythritol 4-phosphate cytidylyltransferase [Desulfobacteraceae bacterium]|jgi:2-C-methyl-D-erythritol 4-phosphate cytidylyltransferase